MKEKLIFTGNSNPNLAKAICSQLKCELGKAIVDSFPDGESHIQIGENVRGRDVFVIQSTSNPANHYFMELLILVDALKRASAESISAVIPYFGYARQDRKDQPRVPITGKLVADLLQTAGVQRVITTDLHAGQIQGFFNIPVDNLTSTPVFYNYFRNRDFNNLVVLSPDVGGIKMARDFSRRLPGSTLGVIDKNRKSPDSIEDADHWWGCRG
jgi:ribose-phosphate pyrophosphokinase